jgi:hypothetical protein
VTVSNVTEGSGLTEAGINVFQSTDSNKQRATPKRRIMRMLVCYEEILGDKVFDSPEISA